MPHPIYDARPPILGREYDGEHDEEIEELRERLFAHLDGADVVVATDEKLDKKTRAKMTKADAVLVAGGLQDGGDELCIAAEALNRWFPRGLDRFLVLYGLWERQAYFETEPIFYSAAPPPIIIAELPARSYYIVSWRGLLRLSWRKAAKRALKEPGVVPILCRDKAMAAAAAQRLIDHEKS